MTDAGVESKAAENGAIQVSQTQPFGDDPAPSAIAALAEAAGILAYQTLEKATETVGKAIAPIADHSLVKYIAKLPGIKYLATALGQVDATKIEAEVAELQQQYPYESHNQLTHRIVLDYTFKAAGVGLATNILPPVALTLMAVDIAAIAQLQAEMVYKIAAAYGFSLKDPTRRGEVLAIYGMSIGGSSAIKSGLSLVELVPVIGAVVGASSDAALLYSLGYVASRYYEAKVNTRDRSTGAK